MRSINYTQALQDSALRAGDIRLVASFIQDVKPREEQFFYKRKLAERGMLRDEFAQAIRDGVSFCCDNAMTATPHKIATAIVENGLITGLSELPPAEQDGIYNNMVAKLTDYAAQGAETLKEWRRLEAVYYSRYKEDRSATFAQTVQQIMGRQDGKTHTEKLYEVKKCLEEVLGMEKVFGVSLNPEGILTELREMPARMQAEQGKPIPELPPHFGKIAEVIRFLRKGEMSVFSAPTGAGKSMFCAQTGEWNALAQGLKVLMVFFEDDKEVILGRAAARWTDTAYMEIEEGDPRGALARYGSFLKQRLAETGGEIRIEVRPDIGGSELVIFLAGILEEAQAAGRPYDMVVVDYLQKIAFFKDAKLYNNNEVLAIQYTADRLRWLATTHKFHIMITSQVTKKDDGYKIAWGQAVENKAQLHLQGIRANAPKDIPLYGKYRKLQDQEVKEDPMPWIQEGEPLPFVTVRREKGNRRRFVQETVYLAGPSQKMIAPSAAREFERDPEAEWRTVRFEIATDARLAEIDRGLKVQKLGLQQAERALAEVKATQKDRLRGSGQRKAVSNEEIPGM